MQKKISLTRDHHFELILTENIRGYPEIAQKAIEGAKVTCRNMHWILRELKIRITFASNSISLRILSE